ncbi:ABC transporter substrate-binding protein [Saliterribacillus persicus]|uniref:Peptide/nickel transport system substrate-binding protein n=1 Tax=Saliterribacillus persicus TaxID=930114 RepID=A0A368YC53_9BACI|nr:ABC transporter substrate-binding protein [Saliterribacillus persicus]RCW77018.1 peptide/nickel transport system substrate-binding protein [Saliterribacillus persicus]
MKRFGIILAIFMVVVIVGCSVSSSKDNTNDDKKENTNATDDQQEEKSEQQELIIADQEIAASLDPVEPLTSSYLRNIGAAEALFKVNAKGEVEPSLAESAEEINDTTWEINLRTEASFWSGEAIDADAVIASLERSKSLDLQAEPFLNELSFTKVDDYTIQVETEHAKQPVPLNLSYYQTVIHNADKSYEDIDSMDLSGMYKVTSFSPAQKMELELNENYWGETPSIPKIVHEQISDAQTRALSVLSGSSDIAIKVPVTSLTQFAESDEAETISAPPANTQTIYLNLDQPQFENEKVRQALSWGLNREELVELGAEGQSTPVTTWLASNPTYEEAKNAVYPEYDPDKAEALLDEAGWGKDAEGTRSKDGETLTVKLMTWGDDQALGETIQNQWTQIGVQVEVQHGDYNLIQTARESGEWDASIEAWSTFGDEHALLTGQFSPDGSGNYGGYNDEQTNQLLDDLAEITDPQARRELALQINERVAEQAPVISLYPRPQLTAVSTKLNGFEAHFRQFEHTVHAGLSFGTE